MPHKTISNFGPFDRGNVWNSVPLSSGPSHLASSFEYDSMLKRPSMLYTRTQRSTIFEPLLAL